MYTIALLTHNGHIHPDRVSVSAQTRAHARAKSERLWANRGVCPQVESMHDSLRLCQPEWLGPWRFWICLGRSRDTSPPCTPPLPSPPRAPFPLQSETTIAPPSNAGGEDPTMARAPKPAHARTLGRAALGVQRIWHSADVFAPLSLPRACVRPCARPPLEIRFRRARHAHLLAWVLDGAHHLLHGPRAQGLLLRQDPSDVIGGGRRA